MWASLIEEFKRELANRVKLDPDLQAAVQHNPEDLVLKRACFDWMMENGSSLDNAKLESGWTGE
jgi:hypothetical protein